MRRISIKIYYTYILTNKYNSVLYIGITSDLNKRIWEHKHKLVDGFTKQYNVWKLVYFAEFDYVYNAIAYEKKLKGWSRKKKMKLISSHNPYWEEIII